MSDLLIMLASALFGAAIASLLMWRGYSVRPTKLSLPFLEADLSRFAGLSAVRFFEEVSVRVLKKDLDAIRSGNLDEATPPLVLIHIGWNIVCEAFVRRFQVYPEDERIMAAAAAIGGQNVEFVRMYRDIHVGAIRHAGEITREFAANYLVRAPSLAERIEGGVTPPLQPMARDLLATASVIIQDAHARPPMPTVRS